MPAAAIIPLNHRAEDTREEAVAVSEFVASHGWKKDSARYIELPHAPVGIYLRTNFATGNAAARDFRA